MVLTASPVPDDVVATIDRRLQMLMDRGALILPGIDAATAPGTFSVSFWHQAVTSDPDVDLRADNLMEHLTPAGHRAVLHNGDDRTVIALLELVEVDSGYRVVGLSNGPMLDSFVDAVAAAEQAVEGEKTRYTPVLLALPLLHLATIWLQPEGGADDLFVTFSPVHAAKHLGLTGVLKRDAFLDRLGTLTGPAAPDGPDGRAVRTPVRGA